MTIYRIEAQEEVYYTLFVEADTPEMAEDFVKNYGGDWNKHIVDGDYFEITDVNEVKEEDVYFPILDVKKENNDWRTHR